MGIDNFKSVGTRLLGRGVLVVRKYSPEILTTVGVVGMVASSVMAAKSTLKLSDTLEEAKNGLETAKKLKAEGRKDYSDQDYTKDVTYIYLQAGKSLGKLYGPALSLGIASIVSIVSAHGIMRKRNAALVAGYKVIEEAFSAYRKRVEEVLGEDREREIYVGLEEREVEDEESGELTKILGHSPNKLSPYARFFDEASSQWSKQPEYNLLFLRAQQNYANDLLQARGHIFLNEVYDMIGVPRSQAGQVVGWVLSKDGDNFVDFGIYNFEREKVRDFVNGYERSILLDFNVDGVVYDLI